MKIIYPVLIFTLLLLISSCKNGKDDKMISATTDSLPSVLAENHSDLIYLKLRYEAALKFAGHVLPHKPEELIQYKTELRKKIIEKAGIIIDHDLPLNIREKGSVQMKGYTVRNILFQTRPGVYATANLFVPDGKGPFPGVINMPGHWRKGKIDSTGPQPVGHTLATNGYVCLTVDPWGSGERTTTHGDFEYHGSNLGASLMNLGESLLGIQVSDNMRGVDLLCSLPQVDPDKIGATGASGGGNQTMWLAAVDERVKAAVPVVSVGTFESYIMRSNCICELLVDGLTFTEESGVLFLANAVMLLNHTKDDNPTFFPSEMLRSYNNAKKAFTSAGQENNIAYRLFELPHGYMAEDREAMLGWFDLHLKNEGTGSPKKEIPFTLLPEEKLMVFPSGQRDNDVISTDQYCIKRGNELKAEFLNSGSVNAGKKKEELKEILRMNVTPAIYRVSRISEKAGWELITLETDEKTIIPVLLLDPSEKNAGYNILCSSDGKESLSLALIEEYKKKGEGIAIVDLSGTGELTSTASFSYDYNGKLHTLSRAELWLGRTILGEWVNELGMVSKFLRSEKKAEKISIDGTKEAGLAGLFLAALDGNIESVKLRQAPVSYLFDNRENVNFYSMGIHLPRFLVWGDVSLAAALTGKNVTFIDPLTMSGRKLSVEEFKLYQDEYFKSVRVTGMKGRTIFNFPN
ncbi:MAG: hypothetical protein A2X05_12070 [Bacteroidetes bacterium GWE2_41_25]|nr:MAG: hypothetical protein A2X03_14500 [Bacteroidetes bacterium GWA2_40_15]OFX86931.1 MAG: hypothetical protein A2X06_01670 [Bacteroidetes bacterium GWC2_40_22]OFX92158.1 MAG: hypothetical protein A2X05_12070 [Bacteroidetes bacterium GWE2_41_25]OFY61194.1 MAG: hypothetical protein A2X04_04985 [Bacteroidetes bacterium GWF2_41_9]HBH83826.1 gluconolactonase [Bacteroidales bacterium]